MSHSGRDYRAMMITNSNNLLLAFGSRCCAMDWLDTCSDNNITLTSECHLNIIQPTGGVGCSCFKELHTVYQYISRCMNSTLSCRLTYRITLSERVDTLSTGAKMAESVNTPQSAANQPIFTPTYR